MTVSDYMVVIMGITPNHAPLITAGHHPAGPNLFIMVYRNLEVAPPNMIAYSF